MLLHLCLFALALAQDGTNGGCTCKDPATLTVCGANQAPYDPADPCKCLSCRRPECVTCPDPGVNCTNDVRPRMCFDCTNRTCCPKCNPVEQPPCATNCPASVLPPCQPGTTARPCTECPTCAGTCDYNACPDRATLPVCDGQVSREGCCDTCVPPDCTDAQRIDCKNSIANNIVPECKPGEIAKFVNCCVSCVPPAPPTNTCPPEQVATALAAVPECQPGQRAEIIPDRCTKTCREPGTNCPPNTVRDFSTIKPCPDGVRPTFTGCTPDCLIPPPVCTTACAEGEKCVRVPAANALRCVKPELCRTFVVAGIDTNANPTDVFTLIVKRHCEDVTRSTVDKCPIYEALLTGSLQCKRTGERKDGDKVFTLVECCHARDSTPTVGRRLFSGETLFGSAVSNPGATSGLEFSAEDESSATALTGVAGLLGFLFL